MNIKRQDGQLTMGTLFIGLAIGFLILVFDLIGQRVTVFLSCCLLSLIFVLSLIGVVILFMLQ